MSPNPLATVNTKAKQARQLLFCDRTAKHFKHPTDYLKSQSIAGYIGFLGHQNLGDDILFAAFQSLFPTLQFLTYDGAVDSVHNPPFSYYPVELALYKKFVKPSPFYNVVFLGGGTLINRKQYLSRLDHALQQGNRCVVFGTGVADPVFWHSHDGGEDYLNQIKAWIPLLKESLSVQVRGPRSARILAEYGLYDTEVIGDPALAMCRPRALPHTITGTIGLNVGSHGVLWGEETQIYKTVIELIRKLIAIDWRVELLPFHQGDLALSQQIAQEIGSPQVSIWTQFTEIEKTLQRIKTYDLVIGQRLHSIVLSCGCAVPFIALKYTPKCEDFLESIGLQSFALRTDELELDALLALVAQVEKTYTAYCQQLVEIGNHYRRLQQQAAQKILELVQ
ncbi:MAG TPA: polysaccharide pyruvyl transferase family protein [Leptolyngbyaceae cyanobacterium]